MTNENNVWKESGDRYYPDSASQNVMKLSPGIYRFVQTPVGWYLERTAKKYTFQYKIYGTNDTIIKRVEAAWKNLNCSFGILLNGLKGTGKTITAQMIVNWAIDHDIVVLNVKDPVPLADIVERISQPLLVMFDEFEKTHDEKLDPECQQKLLSTLDGLSRNEHKRIYLFTTNDKTINVNFIDRPSRIRYSWEFGRLGVDVIEMLLEDMLNPELSSLKGDIIAYLNSRDVLTIDVAKTVITECNVFKEAPDKFASFLNLTEKAPGPMKISIVRNDGTVFDVHSLFKSRQMQQFMQYMTETGRERFIDTHVRKHTWYQIVNDDHEQIIVYGPTDKNDEWICELQVPAHRTWAGNKLANMAYSSLWMDEKPTDWIVPTWAKKTESGEELTDEEENDRSHWLDMQSVYGGRKRARVKVRITPNEETYKYDYHSMMKYAF